MLAHTCRRAALVLVSLLAVGTAFGQERQSAAKPYQPQKTEPAKKEKLVPVGVYAGKVVDVDKDKKSFVMRVHGQTAQLKMPGQLEIC